MASEGRAGGENLAALLTAPGAAAIAVVRLAGPGVGAFLASHFSRPTPPGRCVHGDLSDERGVVDDPVVVAGPAGEWADLSLHGGPWVVRSVLKLAAREGFRTVEGPEAWAVAARGDAAGGLEAAVLAHLPLARTREAIESLLGQEDAWRQWIEAGAVHPTPAQVFADAGLYWLVHPPRVALVGAANAGKSTLANQLFGRDRVITADLPGTTRDWVGETADLDGLAITLIDTPGIRATDDAIEAAALRHSAEEIDRADAVVLVLDGGRALMPDQQSLMDRFSGAIQVINKCDTAPAWDWDSVDAIRVAATTGGGRNALRQRVRSHFGLGEGAEASRPRWWTADQRQALSDAAARPEGAADRLRRFSLE